MFNFKNLCAVVTLLLMMVSGVQAETHKRIWQNASGEGLSDFQANLKQNGYDLTELDIKAKDLGFAAYDVAVNNHLLDLVEPQFRTREAYAEHFLKFAFGKNIPERITWAFFKSKGQGKVGWRLPVDDKYGKQLQAMENKFVQAILAQDEALKTELKVEVSKLSAVDEELKEAIKALGKSVEAYRNGTLSQQDLDALGDKVTQFSSRIDSLESTVGTQDFQINLLALGVVVLGLLMIISGIVRDRRTKAVEVRTEAVEGRTSALEKDSKAHSLILNGDGTKGNRGLIAESARQTAIISRLEARMDGIVGFLDKDMDVSLNEIEGREGNLDNNQLANLPLGSDNATVWRFTVRGKPGSIYQPLLWRTRETPDGFLCIGLSKSLNGEPCCEAKVNIENLRLEIASLVSKGLIDPDPVLSNKPALSMVSKA